MSDEYWILRRPGGVIDTLVFGLPQTWRNVDGLPGLSDEALLAFGWQRLAAATLSDPDKAALMPLVEGAGGCLTNWQGEPWRDGDPLLACGDAHLHARVAALLAG